MSKRMFQAPQAGPSPVMRKWLMNSAKICIAFEVLTFAGCYGLYYQMNKNPEFAQYMNANFPVVIETARKVDNFYDSINPFKGTIAKIQKWQDDKKN